MRAIVKEHKEVGFSSRDDVPKPKVGSGDILVRVRSAAICGSDIHIYNWSGWCETVGIHLPLIFGHEFSGEVVSIGENVASVKPGDTVAGETHIPCGHCFQCRTGLQHICQSMKILGIHTDGAFADYISIPEVCAWKLPEGTPFDVGAIYEPLGVAVHGVLVEDVAAKTVAVFGCGPIGSFAVGVAKASGASRIFAVDIVDSRLKIAKKMGADLLLNPQRDDVVNIIREETRGIGADVFIELAGSPKAAQQGLKALRKGGRASFVGLYSQPVELELVNDVIYKEAKIYGVTGREMFQTWWKATALVESGRVDPTPAITHKFPMSEFREAIELAKSGEAGKIIINIE